MDSLLSRIPRPFRWSLTHLQNILNFVGLLPSLLAIRMSFVNLLVGEFMFFW